MKTKADIIKIDNGPLGPSIVFIYITHTAVQGELTHEEKKKTYFQSFFR